MRRARRGALLTLLGALLPPCVAAADAPYVPGEVLVKFRTDAAVAGVRRILSGIAGERRIAPRIHRLTLASGRAVPEVVAELQAQPEVDYAQPNYVKYLQFVPDDPRYGMQWGLKNVRQAVPNVEGGGFTEGLAGADISAEAAWEITTGDPSVVIAVIDSGIDASHADLAPNLWRNRGETPGNGRDDDANGFVDDVIGWDFVDGDNDPRDPTGHGTLVAGVIAARGANGVQIAGMNWRVSLMTLRAGDAEGAVTSARVAEAIDYAVAHGARIINASWGVRGSVYSGPGFDQIEYDAIAFAARNGVLFVAAACNDGRNNDAAEDVCVPASYDLGNIIAVAASDQFDELAGFSNYGAKSVDIAAPGVNILSTVPGGKVAYVNGTSIATPFVSGAAGLVLARPGGGGLSVAALRAAILEGADILSSLASANIAGGRRLNAAGALARAGGAQELQSNGARAARGGGGMFGPLQLAVLGWAATAVARRPLRYPPFPVATARRA